VSGHTACISCSFGVLGEDDQQIERLRGERQGPAVHQHEAFVGNERHVAELESRRLPVVHGVIIVRRGRSRKATVRESRASPRWRFQGTRKATINRTSTSL
jgi:hypothetical protein